VQKIKKYKGIPLKRRTQGHVVADSHYLLIQWRLSSNTVETQPLFPAVHSCPIPPHPHVTLLHKHIDTDTPEIFLGFLNPKTKYNYSKLYHFFLIFSKGEKRRY